MVKVDIRVKGEKKVIDLQVRSKAGRELLLKSIEMTSAKDEDAAKSVQEYMDLLDQVTGDSAGLSKEELDNLLLEEKNKLTGTVVELARDSLGLSKLFNK